MIRPPVFRWNGGPSADQAPRRARLVCLAATLFAALAAASPAAAHPLVELVLLTAKAGAKYGGRLAGPVEQLTTQVVRNKVVRDDLLEQLARTNPALGEELAKGWSLAERSGMLDDLTMFSVTRVYGPTGEALATPAYRMEWATAGRATSALEKEVKASPLAECTLGLSLGSLSTGTTLRSPVGCALIGGPVVGALGCELLDLECVERARSAYDRLLSAVTSPPQRRGE